ncbi:MAG: hypothetical protein ACKVY0_07365 [Prosthecobacter sp.]|uniref:hypothetical protein n=1 Tax=Prosthecobacter sp. TaxID=1965333 RepID=UPI0039025F53
MKVTIDTAALFPSADYKQTLQAINEFIARQPKTRENALKSLFATGMYTRTGKLKKQYR